MAEATMKLSRWLAVGLMMIVAQAIAQDVYPSKPIRLIVPYPPGGVVDVRGRELADRLAKYLRQPVIVENRPGAGGAIGTASAAKGAPDGYTLLIAASSQMVFEPLLNPNVSYDPDRDFLPVAGVTRAPFFLVVNAALPVQTTKEFVALARSKPGVLSYGSAGAGTSTGTVAELFKRTAQIDLAHVPYKGDAQAFVDLVGGHIDAQFVAYPVIGEMLRAGRVRALMHTGEKRIPAAPQVPSASEEGYSEVTVYGWIGVFVPAKTSAAIVQRLNAAITRAIAEPDFRTSLENSGNELTVSSPEDFLAFIRTERAKWTSRIAAMGLRAE